MAPQELIGETLGDKHRDYNGKLKECIAPHEPKQEITHEDGDINNLLKIDAACHNKDVEYILAVLQSEDMLYVSKALARSTWLVTDQQYANIINHDYLEAELYPKMTVKASLKLKKHIRHNIKDESRAEDFYLKEKDKSEALKWLPHCSASFIENHIEGYVKDRFNIKPRLYKRLCEKSIGVIEIVANHLRFYERRKFLEIASFILNTDTNIDRYLDIIESEHEYCDYGYPQLKSKATDLIMKHAPNRVVDNFHKYVSCVHLPTFVKYLKGNEIEEFLSAQAKKDLGNRKFSDLNRLFDCETLKLFVRRLPKSEQIFFVKNIICLYKGNDDVDKEETDIEKKNFELYNKCRARNPDSYIWYEFSPFEDAYQEITKLIAQNVNDHEKRDMLCTLITIAGHNLKHLRMILNHILNKHKNVSTSHKIQFVTDILKRTPVTKYDDETWKLMNDLLTSMKIYESSSELSSNDTEIVNSIIVYNALNDRKTPEVIENLFSFDTLKSYKSGMNQDQQNKVFVYLYDYILSRDKKTIADEEEFTESMNNVLNTLKLLKDWDKSLTDYPLILTKIKDLIALKKSKTWKISLSALYNVNKSWRRHMFSESLELSPCEEVCLNALKHAPQLLLQHADEVRALRTDDHVSLRRLLAKLRVYWPNSLAQQWIDAYLQDINEPKEQSGQKAVMRGLCAMLPPKQLLEFIEKYKPTKPKIDWKEIDERVVNVQRFLAKTMHVGRPQPPPDAIVPYAAGDYLQFALSSLLAIYYNIKPSLNRHHISKLLDTPVSLQKHGLRLAYKNLNRDELKIIFLKRWQASKNASLRAIIFKFTYKLLCKETDEAAIVALWELLESFIDSLTFKEDKEIYKLLGAVQDVPLVVRPKYLVKGYKFIQQLIPTVAEDNRSTYEWLCASMIEELIQLMDTINKDFVTNLIQEFIDNEIVNRSEKENKGCFINHTGGMLRVISAYLLCSTDEDEQIQKYQHIFVPYMQFCFEKWGDRNLFVKKCFESMLTRLTIDLKDYVFKNKKIIPVKIFTLIQIELEKSLSVPENYLLLTQWKLTVALAKLGDKYSSSDSCESSEMFYEFGEICLQYLKNDVQMHFQGIYVLFSKAVRHILGFMPNDTSGISNIYEGLISDKDFIQAYLCLIDMNTSRAKVYNAIWEQVISHSSAEVKMHYYTKIEQPEVY